MCMRALCLCVNARVHACGLGWCECLSKILTLESWYLIAPKSCLLIWAKSSGKLFKIVNVLNCPKGQSYRKSGYFKCEERFPMVLPATTLSVYSVMCYQSLSRLICSTLSVCLYICLSHPICLTSQTDLLDTDLLTYLFRSSIGWCLLLCLIPVQLKLLFTICYLIEQLFSLFLYLTLQAAAFVDDYPMVAKQK